MRGHHSRQRCVPADWMVVHRIAPCAPSLDIWPTAPILRPSSTVNFPEQKSGVLATESSRSPTVYRQRILLPIEYDVLFESDCLDPGSDTLARAIARCEPSRRHVVAVFGDAGFLAHTPDLRQRVARYFDAHRDQLELRLPCVEVPGGEQVKNNPTLVTHLHELMDRAHLDRHAVALTFGGGSVLDAIGYVAATFHRGMRMFRVPTTVLAQNDAGVGVKNGVNALGKKNLLGTFAAPYAVLNDVQFLTTLSTRDRRAGLAEAVKVALVRDPGFFQWLCNNVRPLVDFELGSVAHMVRETARLHLDHIAHGGDPFETGSSRPLDFGHWAAHKLEALTDYELRHGEAVAIGIALDCLYAAREGSLAEADAERILTLLGALGFTLFHNALEQKSTGRLDILAGLQEFREHLGGELTLTLLHAVGDPFEVHTMDEALLERVISELKVRHASLASPPCF